MICQHLAFQNYQFQICFIVISTGYRGIAGVLGSGHRAYLQVCQAQGAIMSGRIRGQTANLPLSEPDTEIDDLCAEVFHQYIRPYYIHIRYVYARPVAKFQRGPGDEIPREPIIVNIVFCKYGPKIDYTVLPRTRPTVRWIEIKKLDFDHGESTIRICLKPRFRIADTLSYARLRHICFFL